MLAIVAGHTSISGEGGSGPNGYWPHRNGWLWSSVKRAAATVKVHVTEEIDVKNGSRRYFGLMQQGEN